MPLSGPFLELYVKTILDNGGTLGNFVCTIITAVITDFTTIKHPTKLTTEMKQICGNNNRLQIIFPDMTYDAMHLADEHMAGLLEQSDISIIGNNNRVALHFNSKEDMEDLLSGGGFMLIVKGDSNVVELGTVIVRHSPILGMTGLKLIIGQLPGLGKGVSRTANGCNIHIGDEVVVNGATIYLQEDNSSVKIGSNSQISWGVDIWCTDAHTITNLEGMPVNFAHSIEIGKHVWIGKDVKIGKNVKIADNSIVGWGSIVTGKFDEPNVILAGIPARIVKHSINWDRKAINKYMKEHGLTADPISF